MKDTLIHLAVAALRALARLPYPVVKGIGNQVGALAWWLAAPRRRVTLINLRLCYPQLSESQREQIG
ncbi:MAG: lipid A biosynthesis lauroyl acyltransferase, partial [Gammaproteobacteria bacterium]|nr:lipid A biosynthesis lauroyl acyltransferase [Gammaproteobacteria bacterium]